MAATFKLGNVTEAIIKRIWKGQPAEQARRLRKAGHIKTKRQTLFELDHKDIMQVSRNLGVFSGYISRKIIFSAARIGIDLLSASLPRTPVDTGELRESGLVSLEVGSKFYAVGTGTKEGIVKVDLTGLPASANKTGTLRVDISFSRWGEKGEDVALICHEDLNYYGSPDHPRARTPFTGPKYLEGPFDERKHLYVGVFEEEFSYGRLANDIKRMSTVSKAGKRKYTVDQVKLVQRKMTTLLKSKGLK